MTVERAGHTPGPLQDGPPRRESAGLIALADGPSGVTLIVRGPEGAIIPVPASSPRCWSCSPRGNAARSCWRRRHDERSVRPPFRLRRRRPRGDASRRCDRASRLSARDCGARRFLIPCRHAGRGHAVDRRHRGVRPVRSRRGAMTGACSRRSGPLVSLLCARSSRRSRSCGDLCAALPCRRCRMGAPVNASIGVG